MHISQALVHIGVGSFSLLRLLSQAVVMWALISPIMRMSFSTGSNIYLLLIGQNLLSPHTSSSACCYEEICLIMWSPDPVGNLIANREILARRLCDLIGSHSLSGRANRAAGIAVLLRGRWPFKSIIQNPSIEVAAEILSQLYQ